MWSRVEGPDRLVIRYIPWAWIGVALLFWSVTFITFVWGNDQATLKCQRQTATQGECVFVRSTLVTYQNVPFPMDDLRRARNGESRLLKHKMVEFEVGEPRERYVLHGESNEKARENLKEIQAFLDDRHRQELRIEYSNLGGGLMLSVFTGLLAFAFSLPAVRIGTLRLNRRTGVIEISQRSIWGTLDAYLFDFDEIRVIDLNSSVDLHGFDEDLDVPLRNYEQIGSPLVLRLKNGDSMHISDPTVEN